MTGRAPDNWGRAARFGLFIVGTEAVPEAEWWAMAPPGVSIHAARVSARAPWADWDAATGDVTLAPDLDRGAAQFAGMTLSAVVVAHSSSSLVGGPGWDAAVAAHLETRLATGARVTTNGADCLAALRHLGIARPLVVYPPWFPPGTVRTGQAYFADHGFPEAAAFTPAVPPAWTDVPPSGLYGAMMHMAQDVDSLHDQIVTHCPDSADGVLIAGTGVRTVAIIDALEGALGRPVVTANQASLWRCLALAGIADPVPGYGRLLAEPRPAQGSVDFA